MTNDPLATPVGELADRLEENSYLLEMALSVSENVEANDVAKVRVDLCRQAASTLREQEAVIAGLQEELGREWKARVKEEEDAERLEAEISRLKASPALPSREEVARIVADAIWCASGTIDRGEADRRGLIDADRILSLFSAEGEEGVHKVDASAEGSATK